MYDRVRTDEKFRNSFADLIRDMSNYLGKYAPSNSLLGYYLSYIKNDFLGNLKRIYEEKLIPTPIKNGSPD